MISDSAIKHIRRIIAPRLDIPFARDDANRYLPYFIALMIFLAAFFLAGGITVGSLLTHKQQNLSEWLTLQLPASTSTAKQEALKHTLAKYEGVLEVRQVEKKEVNDLLSPWFGKDQTLLENLNIPYVMEIRMSDPEKFDVTKLQTQLSKIEESLMLDNHERWLDHYLNFIRILQIGAYLLACLVVIATTVIIIFTSKTALKLHSNAIRLLHSVGAEDDYIARQFQFNAFLLGMRGGLVGVAIAAALFFAVGISINELDAALLPNFPITLTHLAIWLSLPPLTGLLALVVARKTVLAMLRQMA